MIKTTLKHAVTSAFILVAAFCVSGEDSYYSNTNRDIFLLPSHASLAGSDITFSCDATPNSNPATIGINCKSAVNLSYAGYFDNTYSASVLSYITPIDWKSGAGVSLCYLYIPDIEITTGLDLNEAGYPIDDPSKLEYASSSDIMVNLVYGRSLISRRNIELSAGGRLHAARKRLPGETGYAIGLDCGAEASFPRYNLRLSLLADDITTNVTYWNSSYSDVSLPSVKAAAGWQKEIPYIYGKFSMYYCTPDVLSSERVWLLKTENDQVVAGRGETGDQARSFLYMGRYGAEYVIRKAVSLRAGFSSGQWSFGGGVNLFDSYVSIDFSYMTSELDGSYFASLAYRW